MAFEKDIGLEARHACYNDLNRGHEKPSLDHPFHYPRAPGEPERVKRHPAGLSMILAGRGSFEWTEKLPARFDSSNRFVAPPAPLPPQPEPYRVRQIGDNEKAQRPTPVGSTHRLRVMEDWHGVRFGGKRTFPGIN